MGVLRLPADTVQEFAERRLFGRTKFARYGMLPGLRFVFPGISKAEVFRLWKPFLPEKKAL